MDQETQLNQLKENNKKLAKKIQELLLINQKLVHNGRGKKPQECVSVSKGIFSLTLNSDELSVNIEASQAE